MNKVFFLVFSFCLFTVQSFAQSSCYSEAKKTVWRGEENYSIAFNNQITLTKNKSGNYSKRIASNRVFGCTIFSKTETLSGEFSSAGGTYLKATCADKEDYAFMQFVDSSNTPIFRVQCERIAYEENVSEKFVPGSQDIEELLKSTVTVK